MPCTTILVGKNASYDGSTLMARNEDSVAGNFEAKKFAVVMPEDQPTLYRSVISGAVIPLPDDPVRYTAMPNADPRHGIWGEAGINALNVAMSETETITSNSRVLGADPLVPGGIGEEDMLTIVLPYISSAREGVLRLGGLIERYGTYEMNGIGFQDVNEIWWLESVGGHHWMAKRVPDDAYVVMPNQLGIDSFDFVDALGEGVNCLCCADLPDFVIRNHLDLSMSAAEPENCRDFDTRAAFGSHSDADHCYNTPRAWYMLQRLNPKTFSAVEHGPEDDDLPWAMIPEKKLTVEDIKYVLSSYYQGTQYNPYSKYGRADERGKYRPIGINRNNFLAVTQLRPYAPKELMGIEWIAEGSNAFNELIPIFTNCASAPAYLADTPENATTENFYWANRIIGALADAHFSECIADVERYQLKLAAKGHRHVAETDEAWALSGIADAADFLTERNAAMCAVAKKETDALLSRVLFLASGEMKNGFARSDG